MSKDWNYAHMWDTMRRALEESAIQGLEVTPLNVLNGMIVLEELEEWHRKEREERKEREKLESFPIWQLETIREDGKERWRIYRAINPDLPNWEVNRLYMPGTWDDGGMASNIAAEKTAMEAASKTREMQTMFDGEIEFYPDGRKKFCVKEERGETKAEGAKECE